MKRIRQYRTAGVLASLAAFFGVLLMLGDTIVRDQAMIFAGGTLLALAGAVAVAILPADRGEGSSAWENVPWGKFFVAAIYAGFAVAFFAAMLHTPEAARLVHVLHVPL